jgi:hypothetical protein
MTRKLAGPIRVGLLGLMCFLGSIVWMEIWSYWVRRDDPPGWIIDRFPPILPRYLFVFGLLLLAVALIWGVMACIRHKVFNRQR